MVLRKELCSSPNSQNWAFFMPAKTDYLKSTNDVKRSINICCKADQDPKAPYKLLDGGSCNVPPTGGKERDRRKVPLAPGFPTHPLKPHVLQGN